MSKGSVCQEVTYRGYTGKLTQFYEYLRFLEQEGFISTPIQLQQHQLFDAARKQKYHYITRSYLFRFLWSHQVEIPDTDWERFLDRYPVIGTINTCITEFRGIFKTKSQADLEVFLEKYSSCPYEALIRFANGLQRDLVSVSHAVSSPYSNDFVEGNNNKLKMIKRVAYGRSRLKLLKAKMLLASLFCLPILTYADKSAYYAISSLGYLIFCCYAVPKKLWIVFA